MSSPQSPTVASPILAVRVAVRAWLLADPALLGLLGGPKIFDEAPREAAPPYLVFGDASARDWSTGTDTGCEQAMILTCWSTQRGLAEALAVVERARALLDDAALKPAGHHLVHIHFVSSETRREAVGRFSRASLRLRVVTEQNP